MIDNADLGRLHDMWARTESQSPVAARGPRSVARVVMERAVMAVLKPRLDEQREILAHMIRLNDALARRCDALAKALEVQARQSLDQMVDLSAYVDGLINQDKTASNPSRRPD